MSLPELGPERRRSPCYSRAQPTGGATAAGSPKNEPTPQRGSDQPHHQRTTSNQRLMVLLSNLRTDPFCWLCHSTVGETGAVRCKQCRRLFHRPCWTSQRAELMLNDDSCRDHGQLDACLECLAISDENARPDCLLKRVGMIKFRTFLLYMLHFVEEKLEKENAGPFAKTTRHPVDCDEVLCPAALLRLKQKVADGQYSTYAQFLADLRGLVHKSVVIHGEDSGYSKAANYVLESCMQLCNSMDWCEECFERSLPRHGETVIAAILRSLINPCSKLHVVVCIKMMGKMWPALVYRYDGEFVNVRFFGTLEFGRVHKSSVFLLFEDFAPNIPAAMGNQSPRTGPDAAYEHALRQYGLHISKLLLIPECSVEFFPKVTPYDGRLFMKIHSIQSLLTLSKPPNHPADSPIGTRTVKRMINGLAKGHPSADQQQQQQQQQQTHSDTGSPILQRLKTQHISPHSLPSTPPLSDCGFRGASRTELQLNVALQQRRQEMFQPPNCRSPLMESHRDLTNTSGGRLQLCQAKASAEGELLGGLQQGVLQNRYFVSGDPAKSALHRHLTGEIPDLRPQLQMQPVQPTPRKSTEPKRFPNNLTETFAKKTGVPTGNQRGFPGDPQRNGQNPIISQNLLAKPSESSPRSVNLDWRNGEAPRQSNPTMQRSWSGGLEDRSNGSPAIATVLKNEPTDRAHDITDEPQDMEPQSVLVIDEGPAQEDSRSEFGGTTTEGSQQQSPDNGLSEQRNQSPAVCNGQLPTPATVQTQLMELLRELSRGAETQQKLVNTVQQELSAASRECLRQFTASQEKLEAMCKSQLKESQLLFGTASRQLQAIAEWITIQGAAAPEALAYKRGRLDALRNRANWIDKTKQSFWCCVCRNQAHLLCCGVTLYCSENCQNSDFQQHREQCRRLLPAAFDDPIIQTPYGDLSICQTFPNPDLNTPTLSEDLEDQMQIDMDRSPSLQNYDTAEQQNYQPSAQNSDERSPETTDN